MEISLSVVMMSYNQCNFIDDAIKSVLNQNLPFNWELLIGDDASNDNTSEIVYKWLQLYPENIIYFKHKINIGLHKNYQFLVKKSKGKYIALLEADDYWIDPYKCQTQVDLMDNNPQVAWSFTNADVVDVNGKVIKSKIFELPKIFDFEYSLHNSFIPFNNTVVFRKSCEPVIYPEWVSSVIQWDRALHYLRSLNGKIGFTPIKGLAWRRHENALSNSNQFSGPKRYKDWLIIDKEIRKIVPRHLKRFFNQHYVAYSYIAYAYFKEKKYLAFIRYTILMIFNKPFKSFNVYRDFLWKIRNRPSF